MTTNRLSQLLLFGVQVFLLGLLVHFLVHTFFTFVLDRQLSVVWAWKEIVIFLLTVAVIRGSFSLLSMKKIWLSSQRHVLVAVCGVGVIVTLVTHVVQGDAPLTRRILAMRYDYLGFFLLFVGWLLICLLEDKAEYLFRWYARVMKRCLVAGLIRWCVVAIKPGTLKLLGYNNYVFEGTIGEQPPAVYYTQINYGLPRNQFLFERPTTRGFWLTAFFPLFFLVFLYHRPMRDTRGRWAIYALNIILTFSRAAWGSRLIVVLCTIAAFSSISRKRLWRRYGIPLLIIFSLLLGVGRDQIMSRGYSNYGHMTMVQRGRDMLIAKPLRGRGGASVGPGSHRGGLAFNPENQFLQVLIEFGVLGALPRLFLRGRCLWIGVQARKLLTEEQTSNSLSPLRIIMAFSLGMLSLTISGMVLHTFADRMVVYPFMLLFGCALGRGRNSLLHSSR